MIQERILHNTQDQKKKKITKKALKQIYKELGFHFDQKDIDIGVIYTIQEHKEHRKEQKKQKKEENIHKINIIKTKCKEIQIKIDKGNDIKICDICYQQTTKFVQCYNQRCKKQHDIDESQNERYLYCKDCFSQYINMQNQDLPRCHCGSVFNSIQILEMDKQYYSDVFKKQIKKIMFQQSNNMVYQRVLETQKKPQQQRLNEIYSKFRAIVPVFDISWNTENIINNTDQIIKLLSNNDIQMTEEMKIIDIKEMTKFSVDYYLQILYRLHYLQILQEKGVSIYSVTKSCDIIKWLKNNRLILPMQIQQEIQELHLQKIDLFLQMDLRLDIPYNDIFIKRFVLDYSMNLTQKSEGNMNGNTQEEYKKNESQIDIQSYIDKCQVKKCFGLISKLNFQCSICNQEYCDKCLKIKGQMHVCLIEDIQTYENLKQTCKMCPNCMSLIYRTSGCPQMFCTICSTCFDWNEPKKIYKNGIHNPHYFEWLRKSKNGKKKEQKQDEVQICDIELTDDQMMQILIGGNTQIENNFALNGLLQQRKKQFQGNELLYLAKIFECVKKFSKIKIQKTDVKNVIDKYIEKQDKEQYEKYLWKIFRERERQSLFQTLQQQCQILVKQYIYQYLFYGFDNMDWKNDIIQIIEQTNKEQYMFNMLYKCNSYYICLDNFDIFSIKVSQG